MRFVAAVSGDWAAATINEALRSASAPIRRFCWRRLILDMTKSPLQNKDRASGGPTRFPRIHRDTVESLPPRRVFIRQRPRQNPAFAPFPEELRGGWSY